MLKVLGGEGKEDNGYTHQVIPWVTFLNTIEMMSGGDVEDVHGFPARMSWLYGQSHTLLRVGPPCRTEQARYLASFQEDASFFSLHCNVLH
ncbi:hypothetical protein Y1Q_0002555 [Alligator mississippiensis]|uniref:Uncharacterized protein n=1 Tax=Alligator mississippiensis TaxID=8496 RepID=A0A151N3F9_ALLMI|nr:hypothetical protein Y1Q_0002555 [Alligator mississippiensis]